MIQKYKNKMNKLILSILILAMVSSCKKETKTEDLTDYSTKDSVTNPESNEVSETVIPFKKIEYFVCNQFFRYMVRTLYG